MIESFVFLFLAIVFCAWQLSMAGLGQSFELVSIDHRMMTYRVLRRNKPPVVKTHYAALLDMSMPTSEMEWTSRQFLRYFDALKGGDAK